MNPSLRRLAIVAAGALLFVGAEGCSGNGGKDGPAASIPLTAPILVEASSSSQNVLTVSWLPAVDAVEAPKDLSYEVHVSTLPGFTPGPATNVFSGVGVFGATIAGLTKSTSYYVKVVARNKAGLTANSDEKSISTGAVDHQPTVGPKVHMLGADQMSNVLSGSLTVSGVPGGVQPGDYVTTTSGRGFLRMVTASQGSDPQVLTTVDAALGAVMDTVQVSSNISMPSLPSSSPVARRMATGFNVLGGEPAGTGFVWPQTGLNLVDEDAQVGGQTGSAPLARLQAMAAPGLEVSSATKTNYGIYSSATFPDAVAVVGGNSGTFEVGAVVITPDHTSLFGYGTRLIHTICKLDVISVTNGSGKPGGLISVGSPAGQVLGEAGAISRATYPITVRSTRDQASSEFYKVLLRLYVGNTANACQPGAGGWEDAVDVELRVAVVSEPNFPSKETRTLTFTQGFSVADTVTFSFDPTIEAELLMAGTGLQSARLEAVARADLKQELKISALGQGIIDQTLRILGPRKFVKVYFAGDVPIVMSGEFTVDLRVNGNVTGAMDVTETLEAEFPRISCGFRYDKADGWKPTAELRQDYHLKVEGNADATADLTVSLIPSLSISFYGIATGRMVVEPSIVAGAGLHGELRAIVDPTGAAAGVDYWLTKASVGVQVDGYVMADLTMLETTLAKWPSTANIADPHSWASIAVLPYVPVVALPTLTAVVDRTAVNPAHPSAVLIKGTATDLPNPFAQILGVKLPPFIRFVNWTEPKVAPTLLSGYSIYPGENPGEAWLLPTQVGTYTVRLGGYSSMGGWARQVVDTAVTIVDADLQKPPSSPTNSPPFLAGFTVSSDSTGLVTGQFTILDPDGDRMAALNVRVYRDPGGAECGIDVGSQSTSQDGGLKVFSKDCSAVLTSSGTYQAIVTASDVRGARFQGTPIPFSFIQPTGVVLSVSGFSPTYSFLSGAGVSALPTKLTGSGLAGVTQITWICTAPAGSPCVGSPFVWNAGNWSGRFTTSGDGSATIVNASDFLTPGNQLGTYLWTATFIAGPQSVTKSFTVMNSSTPPPAIPVTPSALSPGSAVSPGPTLTTSTSADLSWAPSSGATYYDVGVRDLATNALTHYTAAGNFYWVGGLTPGRAYRWNVAACNSAGCSVAAAFLDFVTGSIAPAPAGPPSISSVSPNPVTGSATAQPFTINGANFAPGATVTLRDLGMAQVFPNRPISSLTSTQIVINPVFTVLASTWSVEVINPSGASSGQFNFSVVAPAGPPSISSVSPNPVTGSASRQTITINGATFVSKPTVTLTWTVPPLPPAGGYVVPGAQVTFVSSTQVQMSITTTTAPDTWTVKVTNPDGRSSNTVNFTVQ